MPPISFTYVNDNSQEVIVGEKGIGFFRSIKSLYCRNLLWPSSAGGKPPPLSRLSDHRDSDLSWSGDGLHSFPNLGRLGYKKEVQSFLA